MCLTRDWKLMCQITNNSVCLSFQEYVGKAGDVLENVFFVVSGLVEARMMKPGKQVGFALARCEVHQTPPCISLR